MQAGLVLPGGKDRAKAFQRPLQLFLLAAAERQGEIPKPLMWVCRNKAVA